jgi:hypothetical protein
VTGRSIKARAGVASTKLPDGLALLDTQANVYFSLNEAGSFIWDFCQQRRSFSEIVDALMKEFDVDRQTAGSDVEILLSELEKNHLLEIMR